eukprot:3971569-Alexandrium_andersonii.AAC.1
MVAQVARRTRGAFTGSRTAGLCGCIPVETAIATRYQRWHGRGFCTDTHHYYCMAYVDNLYAVSSTAYGATSIIDDIADEL